MNSAVTTQCVELYETCSLTVEQISEELNLEVEAVKLLLVQNSKLYNTNLKQNEETFSDHDFEAAKNAVKSLLYAEDESTRFRAARFVIDEKKGRNDALGKALNKIGSINVLQINMQMKRAKLALEKSKGVKMIDVESNSTSEEQAA